MKLPPDPHYRHRLPAEIISHAVWLYHVFSLSLRDVELLLAEGSVQRLGVWGDADRIGTTSRVIDRLEELRCGGWCGWSRQAVMPARGALT